jgi:integrase
VEVRVFSAAPFLVFQLKYSIDLQAYYLQQSTWVDNMVDKYNTSYLYQKRGVYYFSKQVPCDIRQHYSRDRIVICLRTKSSSKAMRSCQSLMQRLEDYWMSLRLSAMPLPGQHLIQDRPRDYYGSDSPLLSEALSKYLLLKGEGKDKTFVRGANRNIKYVTEHFGDRPIDAYTSADAASLRDKLMDNGLSVSSVKRNFSTIRSIINLTITEQGLDCINAFARTYMPDEEKQKRLPIPLECIQSIQSDCLDADDDMRWLVALLSDSGMRLGEAVGLVKSDIILDGDIPHVNISPHAWRRLKTKGSQRCVPLVGKALWAASRAIEGASGSSFLFPRYNRGSTSNANSASAAINKWLKPRVPDNCVIHSFRHSMRDRLRAVECPSDIIDAIGGWTTTGVGQRYGTGQPLEVKAKWMDRLVDQD